MARTISKMLVGKEPVIKSGPELFNKFVTGSKSPLLCVLTLSPQIRRSDRREHP